jgi:hypothetical protein
MRGPDSTLLLLVTCSRDESRRDLAIKVAKNLADLVPRAGLERSFVAFDNDSMFLDHVEHLPKNAVLCKSARNVGYWSAIKWVLDRRTELFDRAFEYLYIVESDLLHRDLAALSACEEFLRRESTAGCVRTQEFSVRWRWRYDKRLRWLPFHVQRSAIQMHNAVTGEAAWFRPGGTPGHIHLSNLHAKLPALNRIEALDEVFASLAQRPEFTEADFFRLMMQRHPHVGIHDGGLFHSLTSWDERHATVSGSYSSAAVLEQVGYRPTRTACIDLRDIDVQVTGPQGALP